jgi:hypothetical protein
MNQNEFFAKKYQLFKKSFITLWILLFIFVVVGITLKTTTDSQTTKLILSSIYVLGLINFIFYLYLMSYLAFAAGKPWGLWVVGVVLTNWLGLLVSYSSVTTMAMALGWIPVTKSYAKSVEREHKRLAKK